MAINYGMDLCELMRQVEDMNAARTSDHVDTMDRVCDWYDHVVDEALTFNRFSSLILLSLSHCTTPFFVTCLFVLHYGDNVYITISLFVAIIPPVLFPWFLLFLCLRDCTSIFAHWLRDAQKQLLSRHQRNWLQLMIEEVGSEETFFALRTPDRQKYTTETFLFYLIETVLDYILLLTFDRYTKLSAT